DADAADVRFVDDGPDLHLCQILGDQKQAGRGQARHHGLADVDAAIDDYAADRRDNGRVIEVLLGLLEGGGGLVDLGAADLFAGLRDFEGGLGGVPLGL